MNIESEKMLVVNSNANLSQDSQSFAETCNVLNGLENLSNVCRTCANVTEFVIPIFVGEGLHNNLAQKIQQHLPIKISEDDVLPHVVCYQCASTILAWHDLVECCLQADVTLQQRISSLTNETELKKNSNQRLEDNEESSAKNANVKDEIGEESRSSGPAQRKPTDDSRKPTTLPSDGKEFVECTLCDKNVPAASWRRHRRFHRGGRPHSCHVCGLGFADRGNLARHTAERHRRLRPHACALCDRTFARKAHLRDHAASHSAARDHVCDVCGRASKSAAALRMHKKMHDDTLGFHCAFCDARFRRRSQLVAHASVHTGERAHACACGRAFRLRSQLNAHARTHDAEMCEAWESN